MDESDYLNSEQVRLLTGKASSFLQVEFLNSKKIPHCVDAHGTPLVRFKEVREFSETFEAQAVTNQSLNRLRSK